MKLPFDLSLLQFIVFPLVLLAFSSFRFFGKRIPRPVLLLALMGALSGLGFSFTYEQAGAGVIFTKLEGDDYETETRIVRERINTLLKIQSPMRARRYYRTIRSYDEAREVLRGSPGVEAVAWGNPSWLNISFAPKAKLALIDTTYGKSLPASLNFKLVQWVPAMGISLRAREASAIFLSSFFSGIGFLNHPTESSQRTEAALYEALSTLGHWNSNSHKAYAWWMAGNLHLERILNSGVYDKGEIGCSLNAYRVALKNLRFEDSYNSELYGAIANNQAVALFLEKLQGSAVKSYQNVRKLFRLAIETGRLKNSYNLEERSSQVARGNFKMMLQASRMQTKLKGKNKRKALHAAKKKKNKKKGDK